MARRDVTQAFLAQGTTLCFQDRDDLLEALDRFEQPVPARREGRTHDARETFCIVRYLHMLAMEELLPTPVTLRRTSENQDPPDFVLEWTDGRKETFELTDGSTEEYQRRLSAASRDSKSVVLPVELNTPPREAAQRWAETVFSAFLKKAEALKKGRYQLDHLVIYDLTGLGLLVPLEDGAPRLKAMLQDWNAGAGPSHRFGRISVLRDLALLLDVEGRGQVLRGRSQRYRLPVLRARDDKDLKRRLRDIDRYCRESSIRHLKAFGSILGNLDERDDDRDLVLPVFREDSDLDLLVEFEPGTRVTLLDMARMERELGDLTGFKVDLRTAEDLSRYFRAEVQREAVELRASA
jgi:predicted nucleotidyltransferase